MSDAMANLAQLIHQAIPTHPRDENRLEQLPSTRDELEEAADVKVCKGIARVG